MCTGTTFDIKCPTGQYIYIYGGYYGLQPSTSTATCTTNPSAPAMCFRKESLYTLRNECENQTECEILVTTNYFGDPCLGVANKQLFIQFQCLDPANILALSNCPSNSNFSVCSPLTNSTTQFQKQWCEPTTMYINCTSGKVINILCAYYGIDTNYKCSGGFYTGAPDACYGLDSYTLVLSKCQGKTNCSFSGNPSFAASSSFTNW